MEFKVQFPTLPNAPIILAILEVKFKGVDDFTKDKIVEIRKSFQDDYPHQHEIVDTQVRLQPLEQQTRVSIKSLGLNGIQFFSTSRKHEIFVSKDTFRFNQHGEYEDWFAFKKLAMGFWEKLLKLIKPVVTSRFSIRYINSFEIPFQPETVQNQEMYFKTMLTHQQDFPIKNTPISDYFVRYSHPLEKENVLVHFAQELKLGDGRQLPFIIDIDVLYTKEAPTDQKFLDEKLDLLRQIKNYYFFGNLTELTLNMFK